MKEIDCISKHSNEEFAINRSTNFEENKIEMNLQKSKYLK